MSYHVKPVTMTVRPRLWRIGAAKEYVARMAPIARIFWQNGIIAFVRPFMQTWHRMQQRENWKRRT